VIARRVAYHGTTLGALSLTGCTDLRTPFEPLVPDVLHVSNTNRYHRPPDETEEEFTIVGDLRGAGFFYALELVKDKDTRTTFSDDECDRLLRGFLSPRLFERGLLCRADDRGEPVVQISPPLVADQEHFDEIADILGGVLAEASDRVAVAT
jgi:adenosylmethionine-8-amino-7-oxononanoate aminotransferase